MRTPREDILPRSPALHILPLDVTDEKSIAAAIDVAGPIDVLVNNAGIGVVGAFEATPLSHIRKVFETNTFGVMAMTQAVIPQMRERRSGAIVNVTSSTTLAPFPWRQLIPRASRPSRASPNSLAHELGHFNIHAKLVEPGYGPTTSFTQNTEVRAEDLIPKAYADFAAPIFAEFARPALTTKESDVAEAVWLAVNDASGKLRFPAGADAVALSGAMR